MAEAASIEWTNQSKGIPPPNQAEDHTLGMVLTGTAVGTAGFLTGAIIGHQLTDDGSEWDGIEGAMIGGSIIGGLALPLGVHGGNHNQGNLLAVEATSIGVGGLGWALFFGTGNEGLLFLTAVTQLWACVLVEQATTPSPSSDPPVSLKLGATIHCNLCPTRDGMGLVFSGNF